jgi:hypothetical protein
LAAGGFGAAYVKKVKSRVFEASSGSAAQIGAGGCGILSDEVSFIAYAVYQDRLDTSPKIYGERSNRRGVHYWFVRGHAAARFPGRIAQAVV